MDRKLAAFARDADVLIHDAQYSEKHYRGQLAGFPPTQGYGHSTVTMACEVAASAETGELVLFHHDPAYTDDLVAAQESIAQKLFPDSRAMRFGSACNLVIARARASPEAIPQQYGDCFVGNYKSYNDENLK
jgi:ribonuclease BN (tRNA processing enzyme)